MTRLDDKNWPEPELSADVGDGPRIPLETATLQARLLRAHISGFLNGYEAGKTEVAQEKKVLWFAVGAASAILGSQLYRMAELWWGW